MARHVWTVVCSKASVDSDSGNVSLLDVIDRLSVFGQPQAETITLPIRLDVAILWARSVPGEPEKGESRVSFSTPDGARMVGGEFPVDLTGDFQRARNIIQFSGLPLLGPGNYEFVIEYQVAGGQAWAVVDRMPIEVYYLDARTD